MISGSRARSASAMRFRLAQRCPGATTSTRVSLPIGWHMRVGFFGLLPDQAEHRASLLDIPHDRSAVTHRGPDVDAGILLVKGGQQGR